MNLIETKEVSLNEIFAQYNPDRFKKWKSLYSSQSNPLDMSLSPHVDFLRLYEENGLTNGGIDTRYYKMHILYGENKKWIEKKIEGFISLYNHIKEGGEVEYPDILYSPIVKNPYNDSYEIYEGHHRVAIYTFLEVEDILVNLLEWRLKK